MLPKPESACLLIADISGYTGYLAGVELDHAQDILADLMDTIVGALRPPFHLSKLEGDAAFVYLASSDLDGSLLQDIVEATYFTFRRRLRDIKQASVCECDACRQIPSLDLKFVAHFGQIAKQAMSGQEELIGRDVILIHRLLKNNVEAVLGDRSYVLYTDALTQRAGIDPQAQGLIAHRESIDIIGEVRCWLRDLDAAWKAEQERSRMEVNPSDAIATFTIDVAAARPTTWEFLTMPGHRAIWTAGSTGVEENAVNGRRGPGTITHCMHGKDVIVEEFIDWRPHDYITRRAQIFDTGLCHDHDARIERWPRWGDAHRHPGRQACGGGHGKIHRADAAAGAIDARLGRNVGEAAGRSCRSATRGGGRRAGVTGFRRPLCQAAGKPLNDPPAAQIGRSVDTAAPLQTASLLATFFGPPKIDISARKPDLCAAEIGNA
jgi:hypothetical protein